LVSPSQIVPGVFKKLQGAFDGNKFHKVPVANVTVRSPRFGCNKNIKVKAAVCQLPAGLTCIIGNNLFRQFPQLQDIISVKSKSPSSSNKAVPPRPTVDEKGNADTSVIQFTDGNARTDETQTVTVTENQPGHASDFTEQVTRSSPNHPLEGVSVITRSQVTGETNGRLTATGSTSNAHKQVPGQTTANMTIDVPLDDQLIADDNGGRTDHVSDTVDVDNLQTVDATPSEHADTFEDVAYKLRQVDMSENQSLADKTDTDKQTEFKREQEADPGLQHLWQQTEQTNGRVTVINGLLYRRIPPHVSTTHDYALAIPACYEQYVIRVVHSGLGGHFGAHNCVQKIEQLMFFPKMRQKIKHYIKSCHQCQMIRPIRKKDRAPLQQMDVMDVIFHR